MGNRDNRRREVRKPKKAKIKRAPTKSAHEPTRAKPAVPNAPPTPETIPRS